MPTGCHTSNPTIVVPCERPSEAPAHNKMDSSDSGELLAEKVKRFLPRQTGNDVFKRMAHKNQKEKKSHNENTPNKIRTEEMWNCIEIKTTSTDGETKTT
jgi:hypothetical protein